MRRIIAFDLGADQPLRNGVEDKSPMLVRRGNYRPVSSIGFSNASYYIPLDMNKPEHISARGRPREFCVDHALAQALRVFWEKGYDGTSLTDLTDAMGITRPSLYAAFGNKESLFCKALDLYEREKLDYIGKALQQPTA